jgi:sarcosine oxidase
VRIHTGKGIWNAEQVLVTTGPWAGRLAPVLAEHVVPHRLHLAWHPVADPEAFSPGNSTVFMRDTEHGLVFGFPSLDGATVKVGLHETFEDFAPSEVVRDPDSLDRDVDPESITSLGTALAHFLDGLDPEPSRISTYMDGYTRDGDPVVGLLPGEDRIWALAGFSGHGFKMSPAFGEAAAQLLHHGAADLHVDRFSPARFAAAAR